MTGQILLIVFFVLAVFFLLALKDVPKHLGSVFPEWSQDLRERRAYCIASGIKREARTLQRGQNMRVELEDQDGEYTSWVVKKDHILGSFELIIKRVNLELIEEGLWVTTYSVEVVRSKSILVLTVAYIPPWSGPAGSVSKH